MKITFLDISQGGGIVRALIGLVLSISLFACTPTERFHGYYPEQEDIDAIVVGVDTRGSVEDLIGPPNSSGVLASGGWYYISTKIETFAYQAPETTERRVLVLSFDDEDVLSNVETLTLEDGKVIQFARRVTELPVKGPGFWRQILGNIGNVTPGQITGGG